MNETRRSLPRFYIFNGEKKRRLNEILQTKDMHGDASKNMDDFFYYLRNSFHFLKRQFQGVSFNQIDVYWFWMGMIHMLC